MSQKSIDTETTSIVKFHTMNIRINMKSSDGSELYDIHRDMLEALRKLENEKTFISFVFFDHNNPKDR